MFSPCMSSTEPGTMIEYWPTSGNVAPRKSLLIVDIHLEQWTMPLSGLLCKNINIDDNASGFIVGIPNFSCYGWSCSMIYFCDQFTIKPQTQRLTQALLDRDILHLPFSFLLERKHAVGGPRWGSTPKHVPDLSGFLLIHIFFLLLLVCLILL